MAYIGAEPVPGQNREVDDISSSFNGSTTAFTLQVSGVNVSPESANNILVNLGGVLQNPGTDYTIAASTITFTTAPASGLSFFALVLGAGINTATVADQTIGTSKVLDNAITADKLAHTSVTAGSYTTADITVDAQGRITAAANGTIAEAEIANNAVTTNKIADDAVTAAKIADDAVNGSHLADAAINNTAIIADNVVSTNKLTNGTSSNDGKFLRANNGSAPTFETVSTDLVSDSSPQLGGDLASNGNNILMADNDVLVCGSGTDLKIFHDGTTNIIEGADNNMSIRPKTGENGILLRNNDAVELYYDDSKKFETTSTGIQTVEAVKMTHGGNGVNLKVVHEAGVGNTASTTATIPTACVGGGTVTITCMHNGNTSITTTKMFPIMFQGNTTTNLGSEIFSINANSAASFSVSAATLGVTVTNNTGNHAKIRVTFDATVNA